MDLSGNLTRQQEADMVADNDAAHVANVGKLVEDMELKMRNLLQEVYFGKAKDVVADLRSMCDVCYWTTATDTDIRHTATVRDKQRQSYPSRDDQQHEPITHLREMKHRIRSIACQTQAKHPSAALLQASENTIISCVKLVLGQQSSSVA